MAEAGRIGMEQADGLIISVPLRIDACICHTGFYLSEIFNTPDKVSGLISGGPIYDISDVFGKVVYLSEVFSSKNQIDKSNTINDYIQLCESDSVDYGYLFTKENKWTIVAGWCIGELKIK